MAEKTVAEKTVYDVRRENLNLLIEVYGSISKLNQLTGRPRTDSSLSQIRNQTVNTVNHCVRRMGSKLARSLERQLCLEEGWFDTEHSDSGSIRILDVPFSEEDGDGKATIQIPSVEEPEGGGVYTSVNTPHPKDYLTMGNRFLDKVLGAPAGSTNVDYSGLRFHEVENDSFAEIPRDTLAIVDTNIRKFTEHGFYLVRVNGKDRLVQIRENIDGHFRIWSDDAYHEERSSLDGIPIIGRVVYSWEGRRR